MFKRAFDTDSRQQLMYSLSRKWGLTQKTDSDGDGVMDADDESPAPGVPNVAAVQKLGEQFAEHIAAHNKDPLFYSTGSTKLYEGGRTFFFREQE